MPLEKVSFQPNVPTVVVLKYPIGKIVQSRFGDSEQVYYTTADGKALYCSLYLGQKINELTPQPGEPIQITKKWSGRKEDTPTWEVVRLQDRLPKPDPGDTLQQQLHDSVVWARAKRAGVQPDGTLVVPGAAVPATAPARATAANQSHTSTSNGNSSQRSNGSSGGGNPPAPATHQGWAQFLISQANALTDVYAACLLHADQKHGNRVRPDDVKSFVITAFIQQTKSGGPNVA